MAPSVLPPDFSAFLKSLNAHGVSFLVIGGYAVGYHGYPRATADIDIWIPRDSETAGRVVAAIRDFGFDVPELVPDLFVRPDQVIRLGVPPVRIELLTSIAGVEFDECLGRAVQTTLDDVPVQMIGLEDLKRNKRAAGRHQDLADLEHLP
ncbi:MAG: nucleotidyltransferase [Vicinamibacterales bacterium]